MLLPTQQQCPQVPGDNWSNNTMDVYQGLVCRGPTCNCGDAPCGEYLFNFSTTAMVDWWLLEHMGGGLALDHPAVDGLVSCSPAQAHRTPPTHTHQ